MRLAERSTRPSHRLVILAAALAALSCGDSTGTGPRVAALQVTPDAVELWQKQEQQLAVAAVDDEGLLVTGVTVTFEANDPEMLDVTSLGLIKASGRSGSYYVRVAAGRVFKDVPVIVKPVLVGLEVAPAAVVIQQGGQQQVTPSLVDINGYAVSNATFSYYTDGSGLVSVSSTGLVRSLGPRGTGSVSIESGGYWKSIPVTVTGVPTTLVIAPNPARVAKGRQFQLAGVVRDAAGDVIPGASVSFSGGVEGIGSVSASGLVTAGETLGSFTVSATSGSLTAQGTVDVVEPSTIQRPNGTLSYTITTTGEGYGVDSHAGVAYHATVFGPGLVRASLASQSQTGAITGAYADIRINADGTLAFVADYGRGGLSIVDLSTFTIDHTVPFGGGDVWSVELSEDESRVFVGGAGSLRVVDADTRAVLKTLAIGDINHLSRSPGGAFIYATSFTSGTVHEVDVAGSSVTRTFSVGGGAQGTAVSPDGATLYVAHENGQLTAVDLATRAMRTASTGVNAYGIAITGDGTQVYVGGGSTVAIVDVATLGVISTISSPTGGIRRLSASDDGAMILFAAGGAIGIIE